MCALALSAIAQEFRGSLRAVTGYVCEGAGSAVSPRGLQPVPLESVLTQASVFLLAPAVAPGPFLFGRGRLPTAQSLKRLF